jgi:tryptophan halogenase
MNIVVVGGGTAGWITALYAKKVFPKYKVSLIESKQIGILGAGEASTPHLINLLDFLEIPTSELIKKTNATIKSTAKFTGWSKNKKDFFYHPFEYNNNLISEQHGYLDNFKTGTNIFHLYSYLNNIPEDEYCLINKLCNNNLVPFIKINDDQNINPMNNYEQITGWSLNFDARLLAEYFAELAEKRNIKKIEGKVQEIILNEDGEISDLLLEDNNKISCDFVFDCSGFARLIIGKKYLSKWISYKDYLPTNKALPFFLNNEKEKEIPPYIEAVAMNYGWMWKTPLQNRYGCGYVFDNNYISAEEAKKEVEQVLGFEIFPPTTFSFEPGTYEEIWIKNCLAVGLSGGFVEPLEATSIMQTIINLQNFFSNKNNILTKNTNIKNNFNIFNKKSSFSIVEYIYWHYVTNKENNVFWKDFTKNNKMPDLINNILEISKERVLSIRDFKTKSNLHFMCEDFLCVQYGHKLFKKNVLGQYKNEIESFKNSTKNLIYLQDKNLNLFSSHSNFLKDLIGLS